MRAPRTRLPNNAGCWSEQLRMALELFFFFFFLNTGVAQYLLQQGWISLSLSLWACVYWHNTPQSFTTLVMWQMVPAVAQRAGSSTDDCALKDPPPPHQADHMHHIHEAKLITLRSIKIWHVFLLHKCPKIPANEFVEELYMEMSLIF